MGADQESIPLSFMQQNSTHQQAIARHKVSLLARHGPVANNQHDDGRQLVVELLRRSGKDLQSMLLTSLASKIAGSEDPFAKVKVLIQELIERLLAEASKDAN